MRESPDLPSGEHTPPTHAGPRPLVSSESPLFNVQARHEYFCWPLHKSMRWLLGAHSPD